MIVRKLLAGSLLLVGSVTAGCRCNRDSGGPTPSKESPAALHLQSVDQLTLPTSTSTTEVPHDGIAVYATRTKLLLGQDLQELAELPNERDLLAHQGLDSRYKGTDPMYLEPLAKGIERIRKDKGIAEWIPIVISIDASHPYRLLAEILLTIDRVHASKWALVVTHDGATRAITSTFNAPRDLGSAPSAKPNGAPQAKDSAIFLGVTIAPHGFLLRAFGRALGPSCELVDADLITVPNQGAAFDFAGLSACAGKSKAKAPDSKDDVVTLTVAPTIDLQTIVSALDALRTTEGGKALFSAPAFAIVH